MKLSHVFTLLLLAMLTVACSRHEAATNPEPAAERANLDHVVVQDDNSSDGEVASKATRESLLKELHAALDQLEKATNLQDAFRIIESVEDLGREVAPELQARVKKMPELPRIAGWRGVWTLGSIQNKGWDLGVNGLLEIVVGEGAIANRVAAAEVLGAVASTRHEATLRKALLEDVFQPEVKVQLAVALWRTSRDVAATKVLRDMLTSENDGFKIIAAVALGEINQLTADAKPILELIADEPTLRGRTARRALDYERAIKRFEAAVEGRLPGQEKVEVIDTKLLDSVEKMIKERYIYADAVSGRKLLYAAASGMLEGLDPYTCLLEDGQLRDAGEIRRFAVPTLGVLLGSAKLQPNRELRFTRVLSVRPDSPAERAGMRAGDRIYRVLRGVDEARVRELRVSSSDLPDETHPFQTLPLDEAISQFSGALGTSLGLNIMRDGWLLGRWVHVTHEEPVSTAVRHEMLPGKIGMIQLFELTAGSPARVKEALAALKQGEAKAIILDLRNCAGGSVEAATQVASLFLPKDTLVTFAVGRSAELTPKTKHITTGADADTTTPLTVLINGGTADSGEVLAGALQGHKRAKLAGLKTFGRAIVQELIPIRAEELKTDERQAALLLTVARYVHPVSEMPFYDRGVEPDTELEPRLFEGWIYDAFDDLRSNSDFTGYVATLLADVEEAKLVQLAAGDDRKTDGYPGFDAMYGKLKTPAEREHVRYLLRAELRRELIEAGKITNKVDLQEDGMFTGAVKEAAKAAGIDLSEIPEYRMISR